MSGFLNDVLRWVRLRGLKDGQIQSVRSEAFEENTRDAAKRLQDYGFRSNPVDGQGLVLNISGFTIVLRMDRLAEAPALEAYEVQMWHKEGHAVALKAGKKVEVLGANEVTVNAATKVVLNTPLVECAQALKAQTLEVTGASNLTGGATISGKPFLTHHHDNVQGGNGQSGGVI